MPIQSIRVARTGIALAFAAVLSGATQPAGAQPAIRQWLDPRLGRLRPTVHYGIGVSCAQPTDQPGGHMGFTGQKLSFLAPLHQSPTAEWALDVRQAGTDIDGNAGLPDTGESFPRCLYDVGARLTHRRKFDNGWTAGVSVGAGSPSDRPFAGWDETVLDASAHLRIPSGERNAWLLLLSLRSQRDFAPGVPLPGVGYHWRPGDDLELLLGVPFVWGRYQATDRLGFESLWLPVRRVRARATLKVTAPVKLYAGFDWDSRMWLRHDRDDEDDRLYYIEKRLVTGVHWRVNDTVSLDINGGFAFDRFWSEGEDYSDRGDNRIGVGDGFFLGGEVTIRL